MINAAGIGKWIPIFEWVRRYRPADLSWDLVAGITLASFVLPESMAYASLAGVPAQFGIYCCITGGLLFAVFTGSRQVAAGPTSSIALMVGATVAVISGGDPAKWISIASLTAFVVFLLCMAAYFLRISGLINFISENILLGFKAGAALSIASTQLPVLFGVDSGGSHFFGRIYSLCGHIPETNLTVLLFGLAALALLATGHKLLTGRPVSLLIVIGSILVVTFTPLHSAGLHLVGAIPQGLPHLSAPSMRFSDFDDVFGLALGCFLVGYVETISAARTFAEKNGYEVNARQELLPLGWANLATAFTGGFPVSGGLSQSTVNDKAGARTPLALVVCSVVLSLLLLYFTGLLKNLPEVILGVIVLDAVAGLIKVKELRRVYMLDRVEFAIAMVAFSGVLVFGILKGVLIASVCSLIIIIIRASSPNIAVLGRIPGTDKFSDILRHADNEEVPGVKIFRVEAAFFYFNQHYIFSRITELIKSSGSGLKMVILDMSSSPSVDISGSRMLIKLERQLAEKGVRLCIVEALSEVRDLLRKQGMEEMIGHISRKQTISGAISRLSGHEGTPD